MRACSDAFARVPLLEQAIASLKDGQTLREAQLTRLNAFIGDLQANYSKTIDQKDIEIKELRAMVLKLSEIASKRSKVCLIC